MIFLCPFTSSYPSRLWAGNAHRFLFNKFVLDAYAVRAIYCQIVLAYWFIGREITQEIKSDEQHAEYSKQVFETLSKRRLKGYCKGFSVTNLKYFRTIYLGYPVRVTTIRHPVGDELRRLQKGRLEAVELPQRFSLRLSWLHYRALIWVQNFVAHQLYEQETIGCGWDKRTLERHIHSQCYERLLTSQNPQSVLESELSEVRRGSEKNTWISCKG